jgi:PAS domain S-box-containing protein
MPHGYCYLWNPGLVWLHVISDSLIALAYFSIPVTVAYFGRKRRDVPFDWMFFSFGIFITACGATHAMEVWNLWHADYWLEGGLKAITALASIPTAFLLIRLVLRLPSPKQLQASNKDLSGRGDELARLNEALANANEGLRRSQEQQRLVFETIPRPVWVYDRNSLSFLDVNECALRTFGYEREEFLGLSIPDLCLPQEIPETVEFLRAAPAVGVLTRTRRVLTKNGTLVDVEINSCAFRYAGREARISVGTDLTEHNKMQEKFEALLESAPDAMVIVNSEGNICLINSQTEKLFGYARAELLGQAVEILTPERYRGKHPGYRGDFMFNAKVRTMGVGLELYARRKDGTEFPVEVSISPLHTEDGDLVSSAIRDVTERKQAEAAMRQSEEKFRLLVSGVKDYAILMLDPEGRIQSWSSGAEKIKGYRGEEVIGKHFSLFYPQEDVERGKPARELICAAEEGRMEDQGWRVRKDGSRFWADVVITPLRDESGKLRGFGKVTRDMTERRFAEEVLEQQRLDLAKSNASLTAANKELEAFSYSVSHDLRAPLRSIDGFSLALLQDFGEQLDATGKDYLQRVRNATQRMGNLIDDLLNLARVSRAEMHEETVDLSAVAQTVAAELQSTQPERTTEFRIAGGLETTADSHLVRVVFDNLLGNAWKFTSKRPTACIEFGKTDANGASAYFVRDDGAGFDPAYAARLFGAFQRLHDASEFPGTGIGLATVQRIIHRHGGRIWAEGEPGKGATFYFTFWK